MSPEVMSRGFNLTSLQARLVDSVQLLGTDFCLGMVRTSCTVMALSALQGTMSCIVSAMRPAQACNIALQFISTPPAGADDPRLLWDDPILLLHAHRLLHDVQRGVRQHGGGRAPAAPAEGAKGVHSQRAGACVFKVKPVHANAPASGHRVHTACGQEPEVSDTTALAKHSAWRTLTARILSRQVLVRQPCSMSRDLAVPLRSACSGSQQ